jgi:uncharacterized protein (TIGR03086 family)
VDELTAHQRANDVFGKVLANVRADQLDAPSPCTDWDVRGVIGHVLTGNRWVGGLPTDDVPNDAAGLQAAFAEAAAAAQQTFSAPDGFTRMFTLPFGTIPGSVFIGFRTIDALAHAWDLARATDQPTDLDEELASGLLAASKERMGPAFRGEGRPFGEEQECPAGRPVADQLAAFLGRSVA